MIRVQSLRVLCEYKAPYEALGQLLEKVELIGTPISTSLHMYLSFPHLERERRPIPISNVA